jgi:predicted outer membrane protein
LNSGLITKESDSYTLKEFAKNLSDDKKDIQQALDELVEGEILIPVKGLLSTKYSYTPDEFIRQRVELLMSFANDQKTRQEVMDYLQGK